MIMDIIRTIRLKLTPTDDQKCILRQTLNAYTTSFNDVCQLGWDEQVFNGVELHKMTYYVQRHDSKMKMDILYSILVQAKAKIG